MNNITIRQRILLSFAVVIAVMLLMGAIALQRLQRIAAEEQRLREDSIPGMYAAGEMTGAWHAYYVAVHTMGLATQEQRAADAQAVRAARAQFETLALRYETTIHTQEDRRNFDEMRRLTGQLFALENEAVRLGAGDPAAFVSFLRNRVEPAFTAAEAAIARVFTYNYVQARGAGELINSAVGAARVGIAVSFVGALLLAGFAGAYLLRAITQPLQRLARAAEVMAKGDFSQRLAFARADEFGTLAQGYDRMSADLSELVGQVQTSGIQVNSSINEITATLREQQATAAQIAATTTEIGATSREIAATSKELARTMGTVAGGAEQTALLAGSGQEGLAQMEETMRRMIDATSAISAKLAVLTEKADNISQVVTTITKVADQTNLLSLNAAIEAEKAGEYGRGFSVVAVEIRRLADQTAVATLDIEQMVREIQSAVSAGVMGMDKFSEEIRRSVGEVRQVGEQLSSVMDQVQKLAPQFDLVLQGMQSQAVGASQISDTMMQLNDATQQTVESLKATSEAVHQLQYAASDLQASVATFSVSA
jgi:methyl-accepting chemotaxis protein WspA